MNNIQCSPCDKHTVAVHEAGHAVVGRCFDRAVFSIDIHDGSSGVCSVNCRHICTRSARESAAIAAAGAIADKRVGGSGVESPQDEGIMRRAARYIHGSIAPLSTIDAELELARQRAAELVERHWAEILSVAEHAIGMHEALGAAGKSTRDELLAADGIDDAEEPGEKTSHALRTE